MEPSNGDVRFHIVMHQKSKVAAAKGTEEVKTNTYCLTMPFPVRFDLLPTLSSIETILRRKFEIPDQFKARIYMQSLENNEFECINNEENWRTTLQVRILASALPVINLLVSPKHRFQPDPKAPVRFESFDFTKCEKGMLELPVGATAASASPAIETSFQVKEASETVQPPVFFTSEAVMESYKSELTTKSQTDESMHAKFPVVDDFRDKSGLSENVLSTFESQNNAVDLSGPPRIEQGSLSNGESQNENLTDNLKKGMIEEKHQTPGSEGTFKEFIPEQRNSIPQSLLTSSDFDFDFNAAFRSFDLVLSNAEKRINSQSAGAASSSIMAGLETSKISQVEKQNGELSPVARCIEKSINESAFPLENKSREGNESVATSNDIKSTCVEEHESSGSKLVEKLTEISGRIESCHNDVKENKDSIGKIFKKAADDNRESAKLINAELENNMMLFLREQFDHEKKRLRDLFDSKFDMIRQLLIQEQESEKSILFKHLEVLMSAAEQISKVLDNFPAPNKALTEQQMDVLCKKVASITQQQVEKMLLSFSSGQQAVSQQFKQKATLSNAACIEEEVACQKRSILATPPSAFQSYDINQLPSKRMRYDENGNMFDQVSERTIEKGERKEVNLADLREEEHQVSRRLFENHDSI